MPPVDKPKSDPLILLLDEIEILSAQTRLMELHLKRAHTAAFGQVEKIQEQFRANVTNLKAKLEDKEDAFTKHLSVFQSEQDQLTTQNQELTRRLEEQQNLIQRRQEESEQRGAEIASLRAWVSRLEAANRELENATVLRVEQAQQELKSQVAQLQSELAQKEQALQQNQSAANDREQSAQAKIRGLAQELAQSRESAEQQRTETERAESERHQMRQRLAQLESVENYVHGQAGRDVEAVRQDAQAKIAALQSEVAHKTALLTLNQTTIAGLEQKLNASVETSQAQEASQQALAENHAAEIARRDRDMAALNGRIAELESLTQQQQLAAADELAQARTAYSADLAALRSELGEKQQLLEQGRGVLQKIEQELRNRNRELQGKLAAKEAVIESQDANMRHVQAELLATRDALAEKERTLAEWQTRAAEQEQNLQSQRSEWQSQLAEKQMLVERYNAESERARGELAQARQAFESETNALRSLTESQRELVEERNALGERAQALTAQVNALGGQLDEKQATLDSQSETIQQVQKEAAGLCAALASAREALDEQQAKARGAEQEFATRFAELQVELERKEQAVRERDAAANRAEPEFKAQVEDLENRLNEKDRVLEARAREIGVLQARVESLSGQAARLEDAHRQALADAESETERARQAHQAEIIGLRSASENQQSLLEERQAALREIEQPLRAEIDALKEQLARQQTLVKKQTAELGQAEAEANGLRERVSRFESASHHAAETRAEGRDSDLGRIAALEQKLQSLEQTLAERNLALHRMEQLQSQTGEPRFKFAQDQGNAEDQSEQLREAQERIAELLERLVQLEAARHMLQENAGHELQQLRDSFETRIAKLRMELTAKDSTPANDQSLEAHRTAVTRLEEGFQTHILDLQGQLAEKHSLLENRNEELIRVKSEMDALQDHLERLKTSRAQEVAGAPSAVELKEEDAVETPQGFVNGSTFRPNPLRSIEAELERNMVNGATDHDGDGAERSNRFTQLEGRVRSWNPEPEKDSALGAGRRWNIGLFKRRWKS